MSKPLRRQNLTYAEREVYRREVLNIPSPLDDWLQTNARMPRVAALKSYLLLSDVEAEYVTCRVEMEHDRVSIHSGSRDYHSLLTVCCSDLGNRSVPPIYHSETIAEVFTEPGATGHSPRHACVLCWWQ